MKKIVAILAIVTLIMTGNLYAQTYNFDITITDISPLNTDYFEVGCTALPINSSPIGPLGVTAFYGTGSSPIYVTGLSRNFTGITPPSPPIPRNFIYFRVWVRKNGGVSRYCDSEWFSYSSTGWTSAQPLTFSF
jgi:hypothetical protein